MLLVRSLCSTGVPARVCTAWSTTAWYSSQTTSQTDFGFTNVPVDEKETLVGKVFSNVAPKYDIMNDVMSGGLHRIWKDQLVSTLCPAPGMDHLDVAGGTGDIALRVLAHLRCGGSYEGSVTIVDINKDMIEEGRKKADSLKVSGSHLKWIEGSAEALPLPDGCMDSYTIAFGIRNVTDRDAALREAHRVLKPGGRFLCLEFSKVDLPVLRAIYDTYSMNVIPKLGKIIADDEDSYRYLVESIRRFPDAVTFAEEIQDTNLRMVDYEGLSGGIVAIHSGFKL